MSLADRRGTDRLLLIVGPCVIESEELALRIARHVKDVASRHPVDVVFKASYDKANRTSLNGFRGPGLDRGLETLAAVRAETGLPVTTDFHEPGHARRVADVVDMLQIPAFLCRQTDMLTAAAATGKAVNVKKGQFLAPSDMHGVVEKLETAGAAEILLTERGTSFGYNRLVVDFAGIRDLRAFGWPIVFDATHSVQLPGAKGSESGGRRECVADLVRAAAAVGIDALFLEVHPTPDDALSDAASSLALASLEPVIEQALAVRAALGAVWPEYASDVSCAPASA